MLKPPQQRLLKEKGMVKLLLEIQQHILLLTPAQTSGAPCGGNWTSLTSNDTKAEDKSVFLSLSPDIPSTLWRVRTEH